MPQHVKYRDDGAVNARRAELLARWVRCRIDGCRCAITIEVSLRTDVITDLTKYLTSDLTKYLITDLASMSVVHFHGLLRQKGERRHQVRQVLQAAAALSDLALWTHESKAAGMARRVGHH